MAGGPKRRTPCAEKANDVAVAGQQLQDRNFVRLQFQGPRIFKKPAPCKTCWNVGSIVARLLGGNFFYGKPPGNHTTQTGTSKITLYHVSNLSFLVSALQCTSDAFVFGAQHDVMSGNFRSCLALFGWFCVRPSWKTNIGLIFMARHCSGRLSPWPVTQNLAVLHPAYWGLWTQTGRRDTACNLRRWRPLFAFCHVATGPT